MSGILNFISGLLPRIEKSTIQKDIETTVKELRDYTLPMVNELSNQYKLVPFKSEFYNTLQSHVYDQVKFAKKSPNLWLDLSNALTNTLSNASVLEDLIKNYLQEDTLRDGITARAAHVLRMVSAMSFVSTYVLEAADFALIQEAVKLGDDDTVAPKQAEYIKNNMEKFARTLADVSIPTNEFNKLMQDIPDVFLSDKNASAVGAMFTAKQIDPFSKLSAMSNWTGSPIFTIRLAWETYQAERYYAAKDRKSVLELRLIHLQNKQAGENNPRLEKEIEGLEARIRKYEQKIRKIEESIH